MPQTEGEYAAERIKRDVRRLVLSRPCNLSVKLIDELDPLGSTYTLAANIAVARGAWEGRVFHVHITVDETYPSTPPVVVLEHDVVHPAVTRKMISVPLLVSHSKYCTLLTLKRTISSSKSCMFFALTSWTGSILGAH